MPPNDYSQKSAKDMSMTIVVDGVPYPFNLKDVTAKHELALYNQSGGLRLTKVLEEVADGATGFHVAAIVFLARLSCGDDITFDDVADHMGLASDIEIVVDGDEGTDRPEAAAAS